MYPEPKLGPRFSIYMTLTYMGIGIGQQLLNFGGEDGRNSFLIAALLFSLSLIPVALHDPSILNYRSRPDTISRRFSRKYPSGCWVLFSRPGKQRFF
jgi:hypothetical protein